MGFNFRGLFLQRPAASLTLTPGSEVPVQGRRVGEPCRHTEHASKLSLACTPRTQLPLALGLRTVVILTPISQGSGSTDGIPDKPPITLGGAAERAGTWPSLSTVSAAAYCCPKPT